MVRSSIEADCDNITLDKLSQCIEARDNLLKETASSSVIATANTILRSLRSGTVIASLSTGGVSVEERSNLKASWFKSGGQVKRCLRMGAGKGHRYFTNKRVIWNCGDYMKGETLFVYYVRDVVSSQLAHDYFLVAKSMNEAKSYAENKHIKRVKQNRGMAKFTLSYASYLVANRGTIDSTTDKG